MRVAGLVAALAVALAMDAEALVLHRIEGDAAALDLVVAHLLHHRGGLRLAGFDLLLRRAHLLVALALRLLHVAGADLAAGGVDDHVAVLAGHLHGALELGAGGVVLLIDGHRAVLADHGNGEARRCLLPVLDRAALAVLALRRAALRVVALADALGLRRPRRVARPRPRPRQPRAGRAGAAPGARILGEPARAGARLERDAARSLALPARERRAGAAGGRPHGGEPRAVAGRASARAGPDPHRGARVPRRAPAGPAVRLPLRGAEGKSAHVPRALGRRAALCRAARGRRARARADGRDHAADLRRLSVLL